jgi:hypothetical protein
MVAPETTSLKMADLPEGVHLIAGELRVEFHGSEDLLQHLFEISQAILNDYKTFEEICEGPPAARILEPRQLQKQ